MNDRFQFLKTYADTLIELEKADKNLARELAWKIIQYGIYDNNEDSGNPIIEAMFIQIKLMIDNGKTISKANSENGKKGGRPSKNWENSQKAKGKRNENELKTNGKQNESEEETKKSKIENRKDKIENNINNNLKIISEDKSSQEEYGNKDVNLCMELIKKYNGGIINGSEAGQRRYAYNLIRKLQKVEGVKNGKITRDELLNQVLEIISSDKYFRTKISSPQKIFDSLGDLLQRCMSLTQEQRPTTQPLQVI